jgi:Ca-activated chloride channel homolog
MPHVRGEITIRYFRYYQIHKFVASAVLCLSLTAGFFVIRVSSQTPTAQDDDVVRVDTDVTNLFFTVTDKQKRFITTLREADVQILEDGAPQQIITFQRETDRPLSIAFLIDVSASEQRTLGQEKAAVRTFIETIIRSKNDEAAIIPFTERAFLEQPFTGNLLNLYHVLGQVDVAVPLYLGLGPAIGGLASGPGMSVPPQGTTAIWDALTVTSSELMSKRSGSRRRAIILLTDGRDTSSRVKKNIAIDQAISAETVVYAIGIGDDHYDGVDKGPLQSVAEATGGRAFFPKKEIDLKNAFAEIEAELRSQYLLAYSSSNKNRDGGFRQMRIALTNPDLRKEQLKFRHRPGYFAKSFSPRNGANKK